MTEPVTEPADTEAPKSGLVRRIGPAIALIIFAFAVTYSGGWFFAFAAGLSGVLMIMEWQTMTKVARNSPTGVLQSSAIVVAVGLSVLGPISASLAVLGLGALAAGGTSKIGGTKLSSGIFGVLYIGLPMVGAVWLRDIPHVGLYNILWIYAVVWAGDTGAYFMGRLIGGPKLAPAISPNKTWAGAIGGATASIIAGLGTAVWASATLYDAPPTYIIVIAGSLFVGIVAQLGDLGESYFKRRVNIKDSGTLIPGHGGALDRLDGFLTAVLVSVLLVYLFGGDGHVWIG